MRDRFAKEGSSDGVFVQSHVGCLWMPVRLRYHVDMGCIVFGVNLSLCWLSNLEVRDYPFKREGYVDTIIEYRVIMSLSLSFNVDKWDRIHFHSIVSQLVVTE